MAAVAAVVPRQQQRPRVSQIMARHPEVVCLVVAILLSLFSKYCKSASRLIVKSQPPPQPLFSPRSVVLDLYHGNLEVVAERIITEEIMVVYYYAPWCASSKRAGKEFEKAATYLQDEVTFVAVNCWYPMGRCRQHHNFVSFPLLFVYHTNLDGFHFTGPMKAPYMISFVQRFLYPLKPIHTEWALAAFLSKHDHAVVGFFDFHASPQPPGYKQFYYAAMRMVEKDPLNLVEFGVVSNTSLIEGFQTDSTHTIYMTSACNNSIVYPAANIVTSSALVNWVLTRRKQCSIQWHASLGVKSLRLEQKMMDAPTLIAFVPHSALSQVNQHFSMLRELSLDYFNCDNSSRVYGLIETSQYHRWHSLYTELDRQEACQKASPPPHKMAAQKAGRSGQQAPCCMSVLQGGASTPFNSCDVCVHQASYPSSSLCHVLSLIDIPAPLNHHVCSEWQASFHSHDVITTCCDIHKHRNVPLPSVPQPLKSHGDPYVGTGASNQWEQGCHRDKLQQLNDWQEYVDIHSLKFSDKAESLRGLACRTNQTLKFLAMDSVINAPLMERLGLDTSNISRQPAAVIIHKKEEVHYVMQGQFSKSNLGEFIKNFTSSHLEHDLRSRDLDYETELPLGYRRQDAPIQELNTSSFLRTILEEEKDVIVAYYAPWCGFCAGFAHVYLKLARYFRSAKNIIFARINGDAHDLPWEFSADSYPQLIFFPAYRKEDSVAFPEHLPKTLPHLISFVLRYATQTLRLETGVTICNRRCIQNNRVAASNQVQQLSKELHDLKGQIEDLQYYFDLEFDLDKLGELLRGSKSTLRDQLSSVEPSRADLVIAYISACFTRIQETQIQLDGARDLYNTLVTTRGHFIELHRLTALQNKVRSRIHKLSAQNLETGIHREEKTIQIHDEL